MPVPEVQGCQREYESRGAVNTVVLHPNQGELISGDQNGNIRVWDLTANACSCELVPEVGTAVRSLSVALDSSMVVAANNSGTCYVWRMVRDADCQGFHQLLPRSPLVSSLRRRADAKQAASPPLVPDRGLCFCCAADAGGILDDPL